MTTSPDTTSRPTSAPDLLAEVRAERAARDAAEVRILLLALRWAHRHVVAPPEPEPRPVSHLSRQPSGASAEEALAAHERLGLPELAWDAGASLSVALGVSTQSADRLLRDALILSLRLPRVWDRVTAGEVPVWRARRIAEAAVGAPQDVATYLDQEVAPVADKIGITGLDKVVDAAMLHLYPEEREIAQLEALDDRFVRLDETSINHTGIADLWVRGEWADLSAFDATLSQVAALLGREGADGQHEPLDVRRSMAVGVLADPARAAALLAGDDHPPSRRSRVFGIVAHLTEANLLHLDPAAGDAEQRAWLTDVLVRWTGRPDLRPHVQPLLHCGGCPDCGHDTHTRTGYRPTAADATVATVRDRTCRFPWCERPASGCDLDHLDPYDHDHPDRGGATCPCNLVPLCRRHHRLKTHAGWRYRRLAAGVHLWTDRYGQTVLRTRDGTTDLTSAGFPDG